MVTLMDRYAAGYSILFAVFFEALAVSWFYGMCFCCIIYLVNRFLLYIMTHMSFLDGCKLQRIISIFMFVT